jgi:sulfate transport system permease protein
VIGKLALRFGALFYLGAILMAPVVLIFYRAFEHGFGAFWNAITEPNALHALWVTTIITLIAVPLNTAFGIVCAVAIVRRKIPGLGIVNAFVDLPLALSPVVVGLSLFLLYGREGWLGSWFTDHGIQVLFALPSMILATIFISLPFVVREVVPMLREVGWDQEEAAATLGASRKQKFWRITLPSIRWAVAYGVVLTTARCLGEFGAVSVVSGRIVGKTETLTTHVEDAYSSFDLTGAYSASVLLAALAILTLFAMSMLKPKEATADGDRSA